MVCEFVFWQQLTDACIVQLLQKQSLQRVHIL